MTLGGKLLDALADHHDGFCWILVFVSNFAAIAASWPLTLMGDSARNIEKFLVVSLPLLGMTQVFSMDDDIQRAMGFITQIEFISRVYELCNEHIYDEDGSFTERMLHSLVPAEDIETRKTWPRYKPKRDKIKEMLMQLFLVCFGLAVVEVTLEERHKLGLSYWPICFVYMLRAYTMFEANGRFLILLFFVFDGTLIKGICDAPYKSLSVQEFWGRRWNRPVHFMLKRHIYKPLRRRYTQNFAMFAVFLVSGFYHVIHLWFGKVLFSDVVRTLLYFILQGTFMLMERKNIQDTNPILRRLW
eukprot:CAMPEP_0203744018 /NCGR_PEP_ID=MMETSP0098-20131031/236_1 /ASSEMBLY_ACC=CAM_ASM_000208 /TAXON_ID=96639 /ORGANISM=" , Strain NY0313808BC1" /LENGTH=300 /DNA_ID=CAMNT_0050631427 /DNA_START=71 /DNA_END=970 /DNA_ORIENTATION=-